MTEKEYIEREAARPDAFCEGVSCQECPFCKDHIKGGCRVEDFIKAIPAADVVEVVRCRECKYSEPYGLDLKCNKHSGSTKNKLGEDIGFIEWHKPHFFCSDGEMRNGT